MPDVDSRIGRNAEETREGDADASHLADDVGQRSSQQAEHGDDGCRLRVVAVADELRHRELAELAQVGGKQHRQQDVAAGPAHQEQAATVTHVGNQAGHRDERRGRHPVGGCRHAVQDRWNLSTSGVELAGTASARPDGDADVQRETRADNEVNRGLQIHLGLLIRERQT